MKFEFNSDEMSVLMMSLIRRRTNVMELVKMVYSPSSVEGYTQELKIVEGLLEKFSPGSVEMIRKADKAA